MRAILNTARTALKGADLYHVKLDEDGGVAASRKRACTLCAPHILASGISHVWLLHRVDEKGKPKKWSKYTARRYFNLAFLNFRRLHNKSV
jgi:hypothetical protein